MGESRITDCRAAFVEANGHADAEAETLTAKPNGERDGWERTQQNEPILGQSVPKIGSFLAIFGYTRWRF